MRPPGNRPGRAPLSRQMCVFAAFRRHWIQPVHNRANLGRDCSTAKPFHSISVFVFLFRAGLHEQIGNIGIAPIERHLQGAFSIRAGQIRVGIHS